MTIRYSSSAGVRVEYKRLRARNSSKVEVALNYA